MASRAHSTDCGEAVRHDQKLRRQGLARSCPNAPTFARTAAKPRGPLSFQSRENTSIGSNARADPDWDLTLNAAPIDVAEDLFGRRLSRLTLRLIRQANAATAGTTRCGCGLTRQTHWRPRGGETPWWSPLRLTAADESCARTTADPREAGYRGRAPSLA